MRPRDLATIILHHAKMENGEPCQFKALQEILKLVAALQNGDANNHFR